MTNDNKLPDCFGILDEVFPLRPDGFRSSPGRCMSRCDLKTKCLKKAMEGGEGLKTQEELIDRGYESGMVSFLERWSKKKHLRRRLDRANLDVK